ncbi:MAG: hypothetical protein AAGI48_04215 [Verrucomicrobiota bacterium]
MTHMESQQEEGVDLREKFPRMKPVSSAPSLFTINGCGLGMYGSRDVDQETGTYIKTRCVTLIFIPLIPLDCYRVADAPDGGWFFLGKEKMAGFPRIWRRLVVFAIISLSITVFWKGYVGSDSYQITNAREKAVSLEKSGDALAAVNVYHDMVKREIGSRDEWCGLISKLLVSEIKSGDAGRAANAVAYADQNRSMARNGEGLVPDLASLALDAAGLAKTPLEADAILSAFTPVEKDLARVSEARREVLEALFNENPEDPEIAVKLALTREAAGEVEGAIDLLKPFAGELGDGEGARLYGMMLLGEGAASEALPYLEAYVGPRLEEWKRAGNALDLAYEAAQERALKRLNVSPPRGFTSKYENATEAEQFAMVDEFISERLESDESFRVARDRYQAANIVVPAVMDLGIAKLRVAQSETDAEARKELLTAAEDTFLELQGVASENDEYRLFLGQVYYWSGRSEEGRQLFDEVLEGSGRAFGMLYGLGNILRDLGEQEEARKLLDEAYSVAGDAQEKNNAAVLRSIMATTLDERIEWLSKGDSSDPSVIIGLAEAMGERAEENGDRKAAAAEYRKAIAGYEDQDRSTSSLNNSSLLYQSLFRLEGDITHFEKAAQLQSEAVALEPGDSILCMNAAQTQMTTAVLSVVGDKVDPAIVQYSAGMDLLRYLYSDESERNKVVDQLESNPNFRKSMKYARDGILLAPKNMNSYAWLTGVLSYCGNDEELRQVIEAALQQEFDHTASEESRRKFLSGEKDEDIKKAMEVSAKQVEELIASIESVEGKAMAAGLRVSPALAGFSIGEPAQFGDWLATLRKSVEERPCSRNSSSLMSALEAKALVELSASNEEIASFVDSARRHLGEGIVLRLLIRAKGDLGDEVREHPAVVEVRRKAVEEDRRFPSWLSLDDWAMIEGLEGVDSAELGRRLDARTNNEDMLRLSAHLSSPGLPSVAANQLLIHLANDDRSSAEAEIKRLEEAGIKVPPLF